MDKYKDTDHQVCLAHVKVRMEGGDKTADVFLDNIKQLFRSEREYDKEMITDEERTQRRQGLPIMEVMINLRANLLQELRGAEKLLYAGGPELSSQVLEGSLHLYKRRPLSDLEQSGGKGGLLFYDRVQELPVLRK